LVLFPVLATVAHAQLWGSLEPGAHRVGYRELLTLDTTRAEILFRETAGSERPGRPFAAANGAPLRLTDWRLVHHLEYATIQYL